jgi:hypothetical protein
MPNAFRSLALVVLSLAALVPVACHSAHAAEPAHAMTPTIDVEVEDRAPDKSSHTARFSLSIIDGHAQLKARDGEARYDLSAHASPSVAPHFSVNLKRSDATGVGDLDVASAVPLAPGHRVIVAKIERADGRSTSVVAQVR